MTINNPIIAFDCDGVLGDLVPGLCRICQKISGIAVEPSDWVTYDCHLSLGITSQDFFNAHITEGLLESTLVRDGVAHAVSDARNKGFDIAIITARGFHPNGEAITRAWLKKEGIEFDHLYLVDIHETKIQAIQSLQSIGNVVAYVDDYLPHLHSLANHKEVDVELFLMDQPWNQDDAIFNRVASVAEYVERSIAQYQKPDIQDDISMSA